MVKRTILIVLVNVSLVMWPAVVRARLIEPWPYDKLVKESDVVVIASATNPLLQLPDELSRPAVAARQRVKSQRRLREER